MEFGLPCIQHQEVACLVSNIISRNKLKEVKIGTNGPDLVLQIESITEFFTLLGSQCYRPNVLTKKI